VNIRFSQATRNPAALFRAFILTWCVALALALNPTPSRAQDAQAAGPEPLPGERVEDGIFTIAVFGDSLADGIWGAFYRTLQRDRRFEILRRARASTGIARPDYYDWNQELATFLLEDPIDAAVFALGLNDMQAMYIARNQHHTFRSEAWNDEYRARVSRLMEQLVDAGVPTYWVGLPIMRSGNYSGNIAHLNTMFEPLADAYDGVEFVPMWDLTADANGAYSAYLEDEEGRNRLMRANDGIHFTPRGYELLSRAIMTAMARDLPIFQEMMAESGTGG